MKTTTNEITTEAHAVPAAPALINEAPGLQSTAIRFPGTVNVPEDITAKNERAAYAAAFRRGFAGVRLDFFSIALAPVLGRGWLDGNRYAENVRTTAEAVAEYIAAPVVTMKKARRTRKAA
jgi:hypothetical protein